MTRITKLTPDRRRRGLCPALLLVTCLFLVSRAGGGSLAAADRPGRETKATAAEKKKSAKRPKPAKRPAADEADEGPDDDQPPPPPPKFEYEPVTLADGTHVMVEKWGETFMGYDPRPPMELDYDKRIQIVVDYRKAKRGENIGTASLRIDPEEGLMFWADGFGTRPDTRVVRSRLDGTQVKDLATDLLSADGLSLDVKRKRLYWIDGPNQTNLSVKGIDYSGKNAKTVVPRLKTRGATAFDAKRGEIYYYEEHRIIRVKADGTEETLVADGAQKTGAHVQTMEYDATEDKLYWGTGGAIRRANRDGSAIEDVFRAGQFGDVAGFALDAGRGKIYWTNISYMQLLRANLDGSQAETLVTGSRQAEKDQPPRTIGYGVAVDIPRKKLYWTGGYYGGVMMKYATISRINLPPVSKSVGRPCPPHVVSFVPGQQHPGGTITVMGDGLAQTAEVHFVDDSTRKHVSAKFTIVDDKTLRVTVPKLANGCVHPAIIVRTPSGVTVTLAKTIKLVKPHERYIHDRFRAGPFAQLWLMPECQNGGVEQAVAYIERGCTFVAGGRGEDTLFAKDGSRVGLGGLGDSVLYHEPFVIFTDLAKADASLKMIAVPAIRPSFVDAMIVYESK